MLFAPRRIVLWFVLLATAGVWCVLSPLKRHRLPPVDDPPWIPLPTTGMDASESALRQLLTASYGGRRDIITGCGDYPSSDLARERYRILISRNAWEDFREITIVPNGEWLDVEIRDAFPPAPPEPSSEASDGRHARGYDTIQPVVHARLRKRNAESIRQAWNTQDLWHAEQKQESFGCTDSRAVILEACVAGRYAIRHRDCDDDTDVSRQQLWHAVTTLLPKPERAYSRKR